jgi:acetyl esterase/lipase
MKQHVLKLVLSVLLVAFTASAASATDATEPKRHIFRVVDKDSLAAFVFMPPQKDRPAPAILLFHGGGWVAGSADWVFPSAKRLAQWGMVAIAVDYRLSEGNLTPIDAYED